MTYRAENPRQIWLFRWSSVAGIALLAAGLVACSDDETPGGGSDGGQMMFSSQDVAPGEECPNGGVSMEAGLDTTGDGAIDVVHDQFVVCHGSDGSPNGSGASGELIFHSETVEVHDDCPAMATVIEVGFDTNDDGEIDDSRDSFVICDGAEGQPGGGEGGCEGADPIEIAAFMIEDDPFDVHEVGTSYEVWFELASDHDVDDLMVELLAPFPVDPAFAADANNDGIYHMQWTPQTSAIGGGTVTLLLADACSLATAKAHINIEDIAPRLRFSYETGHSGDIEPGWEDDAHDIEVCLETRNVDSCRVNPYLGTSVSADTGGCMDVPIEYSFENETDNPIGRIGGISINCQGTPEVPVNVGGGGLLPVFFGPSMWFYNRESHAENLARPVLRSQGGVVEFAWVHNEMEECHLSLNGDDSVDASMQRPNSENDWDFIGYHQQTLTETTDISLVCEGEDGTIYETRSLRYVVDWGITRLTFTGVEYEGLDLRIRANWGRRNLETCTLELGHVDSNSMGDPIDSSGPKISNNHTFTLDNAEVGSEDWIYAELTCEDDSRIDRYGQRVDLRPLREEAGEPTILF